MLYSILAAYHMTMIGYQFISGFAWALPTAFLQNLRACRFEKGDVLYDKADAYNDWAHAVQHIRFSLQVVSSNTTNRRAPSSGDSAELIPSDEEDDSVFATNWRAPVILLLTEYPIMRSTQVDTTGGRLYSLLQLGTTGNPQQVLSLDASEPRMPTKEFRRLG
ncbi:MAG: hypothetical protein ABSA05_04555 [Opitutaceae bacterium]